MARKLALALNPLEPAKVAQTVELASNLRSLFERGGSSGLRKQSTIRLEWLHPNPDQPRKHFEPEAMAELKASIQAHGIIEPLVVRLKGDTYEILCGERRYRVAKELGLPEVPVVVREATDEEALLLSLLENLQRNDLSPLEEGRAFKQLMERGMASSQRELAKLLSVPQSRISKKLALLRLPEDLQLQVIHGESLASSTLPPSQVIHGESPQTSPEAPSSASPETSASASFPIRRLTERHLHAIRKLTNPSGRRLLTDQVMAQALTAEQTETLVSQVLADGGQGDLPQKTQPDSRGTTQKARHWSIGAARVHDGPGGLTIRIATTDRGQQIAQLHQVLAALTASEPAP